jgi:hypothetical protein
MFQIQVRMQMPTSELGLGPSLAIYLFGHW